MKKEFWHYMEMILSGTQISIKIRKLTQEKKEIEEKIKKISEKIEKLANKPSHGNAKTLPAWYKEKKQLEELLKKLEKYTLMDASGVSGSDIQTLWNNNEKSIADSETTEMWFELYPKEIQSFLCKDSESGKPCFISQGPKKSPPGDGNLEDTGISSVSYFLIKNAKF
jgi:hypothetical protein